MWNGKYKTEMYSALISAMLLDVPGAAYAAPISFEKNMTLIWLLCQGRWRRP